MHSRAYAREKRSELHAVDIAALRTIIGRNFVWKSRYAIKKRDEERRQWEEEGKRGKRRGKCDPPAVVGRGSGGQSAPGSSLSGHYPASAQPL